MIIYFPTYRFLLDSFVSSNYFEFILCFSKMQLGKGRKPPNPEAQEALKRITAIKGMFKDSKSVPNKSFESAGFMYLSRFNKDEATVTKVREKTTKSIDAEEQSIAGDSKSVDSSHTFTQNSSEKLRKYALSLATLATKPLKRISIVNEGAITVLIELSQQHDKIIQLRCASAFASFTAEPSIRQRMLDDGALAAIIALAANSNIREIKVDCCKAICNLCCVPNYEFKMVKDGVPFAIMNIAAACPDTYSICLQTLVNMSAVPDKYSRIEDVTEAAIYFTNLFLNEEQEILLLSVFCNLSSLRNNQLRLVEDGCLRIVEKYYRSKSNELRRKACEMLKNFTADYRSRAKLIEINIISIVLEMSKDPDDIIRVQSAKCFLFLSKDRNFRKKIIRSDAFMLIMDTSRTGRKLPPELGQILAKILRILCADLELAEKLVYSDVGNALISLLASDDIMIQQYCTESLCSLFQRRDLLARLLKDSVHDHIVSLTTRTKVAVTKEWCAFALYLIVDSRLCDSVMMENTIMPCILNLCKQASSLAKSFCAAALAIATLINHLDCSNAIPLLVTMLNDLDCTEVVKKFCATALFNLANQSKNCLIMFNEEALLPVVKLTQHNETKVICAGIISRLSLHSVYYEQFAALNVLKVLLELSLVDDRITQRRVVNALSNLSQNEELRTQLLKLNPISYIISLASERDEYLRRGCIAIVCNLSYLAGSEKSIVQAGIIPTLMITSLIATDQVISRIICVKAIVNLMHDRSLYHSLVQEGAIWALSKLALMDDEELLTLCSVAICRLSCTAQFARLMLQSSSTIKTVLHLMKKPNYQFKITGARILTNLLLETNETDESFRQLMVENMSSITSFNSSPRKSNSKKDKEKEENLKRGMQTVKETAHTDDEDQNEKEKQKTTQDYQNEIDELSVVCLCLASQSETCRITIVQTGMLQKIDPSTIFSSNRTITYAYITMFSNIANNPMMRSKVLDSHFMQRMERILMLQDANLDLAVIKAIYCVSCSLENIPILIRQGIVPFIKRMLVIPKEEDNNPLVIGASFVTLKGGLAPSTDLTDSVIHEHDDERSVNSDASRLSSIYGSSMSNSNSPVPNINSKQQKVLNAIAAVNETLQNQENAEPVFISRVDQLSEALRNHLIACLYNLTTNLEVLNQLVSNGIVEVFNLLWPEAIKDPKTAKLILLAVTHLACGKTNSSRMVREGCTKILNFIVDYRKLPAYSQVSFPLDVYLRCSAAFRNLLSVVANQKTMIDEGCLPVLITLANLTSARILGSNAGTSQSGLKNSSILITKGGGLGLGEDHKDGSVIGGSIKEKESNPGLLNSNNSVASSTNSSNSYELRHIRLNCATALKSLTFNSDLRPVLIQSEAITIILAEIKKENDLINISNGLLKELEAESWDNGGRGKQKEGRAKPIYPSGLFLEFLIGISKVRLDVQCKDVDLTKFHVTVLLEDDVSTNNPGQSLPSRSQSMSSINARSQSFLQSPSRDDDSHGSPGNRGGESPHPTSPIRFSSSATIQRNKLKKLASQISMVTPNDIQPMEEIVAQNDGLTIDKLTPFEDTDDALGLTTSRYGKKECLISVNTLALIHYDNMDEGNMNSSSGNLDFFKGNSAHGSSRPESPLGTHRNREDSNPSNIQKLNRKMSNSTHSTASMESEGLPNVHRKSGHEERHHSPPLPDGIPSVISVDGHGHNALQRLGTPPLKSGRTNTNTLSSHNNTANNSYLSLQSLADSGNGPLMSQRSQQHSHHHQIPEQGSNKLFEKVSLESAIAKHRANKQTKQQQKQQGNTVNKRQTESLPTLPRKTQTLSTRRVGTSPPKSKEEEHIKTILSLIKRAKDGRDETAMDEAVNRWIEISRF